MAKPRPVSKASKPAKRAKHNAKVPDKTPPILTKSEPPTDVPPILPAPQPNEDPPEPSRSLLWWIVSGIVALVVIGVVVAERRKSRVEERVVTKDVPAFAVVDKLVEAQTVDGKTVTVRLPVQEALTKQVQEKETVVHTPTPEQQLRLNIVSGFAIILGLFFLGVLFFWLRCHYYRQKVPKELSDWLRQLVSGILGVMLGFLGAPPGESTKLQPSPPAEVTPSGKR